MDEGKALAVVILHQTSPHRVEIHELGFVPPSRGQRYNQRVRKCTKAILAGGVEGDEGKDSVARKPSVSSEVGRTKTGTAAMRSVIDDDAGEASSRISLKICTF